MAEICCDVADSVEIPADAELGKPRSRATARRRRMEIRRLRIVAGVDLLAPAPATAEELSRKRRRLDYTANLTGDDVEPRERPSSESSLRTRSISAPEHPHSPVVESQAADLRPRYGVTSVRGRRRDMEDAVSVRPDFLRRDCGDAGIYHFFGVYDGHGCSHVAVACKERMHEIVEEEMKTLGSGAPAEWKEVMERSFSRMDAEAEGCRSSDGNPTPTCRCELQTPMYKHVGSTAVVAVMTPDHIVVANCGDSRAVLCRKGTAVPLSHDHKPDRPDELRRIEAAGGRVIYWDGARVLGVLAMSRAIGDDYLKPFVTSEPEVTVMKRTGEDECLILASDGLWDVVTNEMACYIVRMCLRGSESTAVPVGERNSGAAWRSGSDKACSDAAMLLTKLALARGSADNVSVAVVDLRRNF